MEDKRKSAIVDEQLPSFDELGNLIKLTIDTVRNGLTDAEKETFNFMGAAFITGNVLLMQCRDKATGGLVAVVCATRPGAEGNVEMMPVARLFFDDPNDEVEPLNQDITRERRNS